MPSSFQITKLSNTDRLSANTFNVPLSQISDALNTIQASLEQLQGKQAVFKFQASIDAEVSVGDLVYFDATTSKYTKALAALREQTGPQGQAILAKSSYVQGVVVSIHNSNNSATLLTIGSCRVPGIGTKIGVNASTGICYLSTTEPGAVTASPGWTIRIPCIYFHGDDKVTFIPFNTAYIGQGQPVIRQIVTDNLYVSDNVNGRITINQKSYVNSDSLILSSAAISDISDTNKITKTHVVSHIVTGPGLTGGYLPGGTFAVWADSLIGKSLSATSFTLQGTQRTTSGILTYTVFPQGTNSSLIMSLPVSFVSQDFPITSIGIWVTNKGAGGNFEADLYWLPYSTTVDLSSTSIGTISSFAITGVSENQHGYSKAVLNSAVSLTTPGTLIAVLKNSNSEQLSSSVYIHDAGFILNIDDALSGITQADYVLPAASESQIKALISQAVGNLLKWNDGDI